jgi:hypothetical protein
MPGIDWQCPLRDKVEDIHTNRMMYHSGRIQSMDGHLSHGDSPVNLVGKGGGGTRLLSQLAIDAGLTMGPNLNDSLDSIDLVGAVYPSVRQKIGREPAGSNPPGIIPSLHASAKKIRDAIPAEDKGPWGFKLPENIFLLPEWLEAFPKGRFAVLLRDPTSTSFRRPHITSTPQAGIGRVALHAAYMHCGFDTAKLESDPVPIRNACAIVHQLDLLIDFMATMKADVHRVHWVFFENVLSHPDREIMRFSQWMGCNRRGNSLQDTVSRERAFSGIDASIEVTKKVNDILFPLYGRLYRLMEEWGLEPPQSGWKRHQ